MRGAQLSSAATVGSGAPGVWTQGSNTFTLRTHGSVLPRLGMSLTRLGALRPDLGVRGMTGPWNGRAQGAGMPHWVTLAT